MTGRNVRLALFGVVLSCALVSAQPPAPQAPQTPRPGVPAPPPPTPSAQVTPAPPAPVPAPLRDPSGPNVRIDVTITDQRGGAPVVKKTVTIVTGDEMNGRIRTNAEFGPPMGVVPLNIDVSPRIRSGKIRLGVSLEYSLPVPPVPTENRPPAGFGTLMRTVIQETLNVTLEDGKPMVVAQSADPISDRQVTIELRATILK